MTGELQKLLAIFFIIFEALIYVFMGGLSPAAGFSPWIIIFQLIIGGLLILFMYLRYLVSGKVFEWILNIFDGMIALFGIGVLIFIINELFGKRIIKKIVG